MIGSVTTLIPNVADLIAVLPTTKQAADARELATAAADAVTIDELDQALSGVIAGWLRE